MTEKQVVIPWVVKKRHIHIDGKILCETEHSWKGYSNGQYNSLILCSLPDYEYQGEDEDYQKPYRGGCHYDGIIEFKPLDKQKHNIIERSIYAKCLKKYNKLLKENNLL